jgi:N-acetylmuramoyl-L-alanine amidase
MPIKSLLISALFLSIVLVACNNFQYNSSNKFYKKQTKDLVKQIKLDPSLQIVNDLPSAKQWVGTTNFDLRKPNFVIIHHTAQNSCEQTLRTFTLERTKVSAHYVICKDGTIHHMLNDYMRAWHGGLAKWGNNTDINSSSIGIEIDNNGFEPFEPAQINSLLSLLEKLKNQYKIPAENFIGHGDIAPKRKVDPNIHFPWNQLAQNGYGIWYNPDSTKNLPTGLSIPMALSIIGYDVADTSAAMLAFKRHFRQDSSLQMSKADSSVLSQLVQRKLLGNK